MDFNLAFNFNFKIDISVTFCNTVESGQVVTQNNFEFCLRVVLPFSRKTESYLVSITNTEYLNFLWSLELQPKLIGIRKPIRRAWLAQGNIIGNWFFDSELIGNIFYLNTASSVL